MICSIVIAPRIQQSQSGMKYYPVTLLKHFPIVGPTANMVNDLEHIINLYQKPSIGLDINQKYFIFSKKHMTSIDHIMVPRLNWDDRHIEYQIALQKFNNQQQQ